MTKTIRSFRPAVLAAVGAAVVTAIAGILSLLCISSPVLETMDGPHKLASSYVFSKILDQLSSDQCSSPHWPVACRLDWSLAIGQQLVTSSATAARMSSIAVAMAAASLVAFFFVYSDTPLRETLIVLKGRRIEWGEYAARALRKAIRRVGRSGRDDLWLLPGVQLNPPSTARNILLVGTQGAGKTGLLRAYIDQGLAKPRGRQFVFDAKGDMTAGLPADEFVFVAPHDARSWALDIGREIVNPLIAREFSTKCVPLSPQDPMWAQAVRATLADITMALRKRNGDDWRWGDLSGGILSSTAAIRGMLLQAGAPSAALLNFGENPEDNRTVMSVMITLWVTALNMIEPLAQVWSEVPAERRFTVHEWMQQGSPLPGTLIFQASANYPELSRLVGSFVAERVATAALAPARRNPGTEPLIQVLDEFPQASIDRLPSLLSLGREMHVTTIATVQDLGQIFHKFGDREGSVVEARFGIRIVLRLEAGETTHRICDVWLGQRQLKRRRDATPDELAKGITKPTETVWEATIPQDFLTDELGVFETPTGKMIKLLVVGFPTLAVMDLPLTTWPDRREAHVPARWMRPEDHGPNPSAPKLIDRER